MFFCFSLMLLLMGKLFVFLLVESHRMVYCYQNLGDQDISGKEKGKEKNAMETLCEILNSMICAEVLQRIIHRIQDVEKV